MPNLSRAGVAWVFTVSLFACLFICSQACAADPTTNSLAVAPHFVGSKSCSDCHKKFYDLWSTSKHGLAMQPYSAQFAALNLTTQTQPIAIDKASYLAQTAPNQGWVVEETSSGKTQYPIAHVLGGKNVYYFLTQLDKGRLQTLPLAYDVHTKQWFDTAASGVRHFPGQNDSPIHWREFPYTFNSSCYGCHVSQLSTNYDLASDTYHTTWLEPGINCETCHGPGAAHKQLFSQATPGNPPKQLALISSKQLSTEQNNAICASCHAKASPLSTSFSPGERFWDHYDLLTYENPDYYPDGRDLGENYTMTSWLMSPCARSGKLSCLHCHTSSGRYRFQGPDANNACMPCHASHVKDPVAHTHHPAGSPGSRCVSCHMPMTSFARMNRSDHSMRPPMPQATQAFSSPNACNNCHKDKDAAWADKNVRSWRTRDYQTSTILWARLIDDARKRNWQRLPEMLSFLSSQSPQNEVVANSLVRLLRQCEDASKWPVLMKLMKDPSPLVRSSVAEQLGDRLDPEELSVLLEALHDDSRLVRLRAAMALAPVPDEMLGERGRQEFKRASDDLQSALCARSDDPASHFNLGNYFGSKRDHEHAVASYETALRLRPDFTLALVNASLSYNALRQNDKAEKCLRRALEIDPQNAAAQLNLAMLLGETQRLDEAQKAFARVLEIDPKSAAAAYNLAVIDDSMGHTEQSIEYSLKAAELAPANPKYAYTHALYLAKAGQGTKALEKLKELVQKQPQFADAYVLLSDLEARQGQMSEAQDLLRQALSSQSFSAEDRQAIEQQLYRLQGQ